MGAQKGVVLCGLSPHPPIVFPEVGGDESKKVSNTFNAVKTLAEEVVRKNPDAVVVIGPHGPVFRDAVACFGGERLIGNLGSFGAAEVSVDLANDLSLAKRIREIAAESPHHTHVAILDKTEMMRYQRGAAEFGGADRGVDHGAVIPLRFLQQACLNCPVVLLTMGFLPYHELYEFGRTIRAAAQAEGKSVAVLASGDLSHRLTPDAPAGYSRRGAEFDRLVTDAIRSGDPTPLVEIDEDLEEEAGECGLRPVIMMMGALDGLKVSARVLSYEAPFGVGYGVAVMEPKEPLASREYSKVWAKKREKRQSEIRSNESPHVALARRTLEAYVKEGRQLGAEGAPDELLKQSAGAFVSLKMFGQLRGCIGTTSPTTANLAEEIAQNAISAGTDDPRFPPVTAAELPDLVYSVDVLSAAEPIRGICDLDPKRYGVIVEKGGRRGLLLPDLEGIDDAEKQVSIAKQKAGIRTADDVKLYRFTVTRYH